MHLEFVRLYLELYRSWQNGWSGLPGPKKAFDTVDHWILLNKLMKRGLGLIAVEGVGSYLLN